MNPIAVRKQVRLGLGRTMEICVSGLYHRLFRSIVTVAIIAVAVAFMMYMLTGSVVGRAVYRYAQVEAQRYTLYDRWVAWIDESFNRREWCRLLAQSAPSDFRIRAARQWGRLTEPQVAAVVRTARDSERYLRQLEDLPPGARVLLFAETDGAFVLDALCDEKTFRQFVARLTVAGTVRLPGGVEGLRRLVDEYRRAAPLWADVEQGRAAALDALRQRCPGRTPGELLAAPSAEFLATLRELGFANETVDLAPVMAEAQRQQQVGELAALLRNEMFRSEIGSRAGVNSVMVTLPVLADVHFGRSGPEFVKACMARNRLAVSFTTDAIGTVLKGYLRRDRILQIELDTAGFFEGWLGFDRRTLWLIGISCIVCIVGIANAMLMSVMERFREIATMKCLGATDAFVMILFVLESCIQGLAGGLLGALLGLLLSVPLAAFRYGTLVWHVLPLDMLGGTVLVALGSGVILTAVASVYPAHVAAKMVPMEAMRME